MGDDKDGKSSEPKIEKKRSSVFVNKKLKDGLIDRTTVSYPSSDEGLIRAWLDMASPPNKTDREDLFEQLEMYEKYAKDTAKAEVLESNSEAGSLLYYVHQLEKSVHSTRLNIEHFEKSNTDAVDRQNFYLGVRSSLGIAADLMFLNLKYYERAIVRGDESSFNHTGTAERDQKMAAKMYVRLMEDGNLGKTAASNIVGKEYGVSGKTVRDWKEKFSPI